MSDGCTLWLDGWPRWAGGRGDEWRHCCEAHDVAYLGEPALRELLAAHVELGRCVWEVSPGMAVVMVAGLMTLGSLYLVHVFNRHGRSQR